MNKRQIVIALSNIANTLDNNRLYPEANILTKVMNKLAQEDSKPEYDYTKERLYNTLSDFGKQYVAERNRENPITSYKEFDAAIYHAFQSPNPRISEMMFLSPFEQSQNVFTQINPDVSELLRGMFMIERGIDDDKTF